MFQRISSGVQWIIAEYEKRNRGFESKMAEEKLVKKEWQPINSYMCHVSVRGHPKNLSLSLAFISNF